MLSYRSESMRAEWKECKKNEVRSPTRPEFIPYLTMFCLYRRLKTDIKVLSDRLKLEELKQKDKGLANTLGAMQTQEDKLRSLNSSKDRSL